MSSKANKAQSAVTVANTIKKAIEDHYGAPHKAMREHLASLPKKIQKDAQAVAFHFVANLLGVTRATATTKLNTYTSVLQSRKGAYGYIAEVQSVSDDKAKLGVADSYSQLGKFGFCYDAKERGKEVWISKAGVLLASDTGKALVEAMAKDTLFAKVKGFKAINHDQACKAFAGRFSSK